MCADITEEEIYAGLHSIWNDKAPCIDGYNALFFKLTWKIIKLEVILAVQSFFRSGKMHKPISCALISLIPKASSTSSVTEFRPIDCCSVLYKIISKMLANRLHCIIHTIISDNQTGFILGRKMTDNIILAHEIVKAYARKNISPRCMMKIDIRKTYDSVEWSYLEQVMRELGFLEKFTQWIVCCVTTISYSIVVNGNPSQPFKAAKWLKQGDTISSFLFVIAMEYLSRLLNGLKNDKSYRYYPNCAKLGITHLSFADDLFIFSRGDSDFVQALQKCFKLFSQAQGLQANLTKSSIWRNTSRD